MPWSNQSGGGGKGGNGGPWGGGDNNNSGPWGSGGGKDNGGNNNNNGGPWGQGPRGGGGGKGPPDLEDLIRRGQDRLKNVLPGGGGSGGGGAPMSFGSMFGLGALAVAAFVAYQSIYTVQPDELGVELLLGKPKNEVSAPGLHFHFWPIETVEKVNTREQLVNIGALQNNSPSGLMLSGDQNIVNVEFSVAYQVADPMKYLFRVASPDDMLRQVAESAMREVVGRRPAQDIFRDARQAIAEQVRQTMQVTLDQYESGISINAVSIEEAAPPREVADAFEEVQRAEQDEDRFVEEANQYSNQQLGAARGEAAKIREDASAYKTRVVEEATGEAARFVSIYNEYLNAPDVTRTRLFLETMEGVLAQSNKVLIEPGQNGQGVVPYLPLPEINSRRTQDAPAAQGVQP
jgi:modulator of FtsH protease HflK